ncbi:unnamed protein product [Ambrosiozyma monospora]|uniref:Unnamed protein product n=1 Tax=Ambrosiozyma monospora TaxID=43982 RepID=A0A9W6Z4N5_AMBMO|nr:unnamed protein product [Ambrosiozyma monospora]
MNKHIIIKRSPQVKLLFSNQSGASAADHQSQTSSSDDQQNPTSTTTGFNFIPVWLPEFTQDDETVYHNQSLNIYTKSLPLLSADQLIEDNNNNTLFEIPDSTKFNGVDTLPITLLPGEHGHPDHSDRVDNVGGVGQVRGQQPLGSKQVGVPLIDVISPGVQSFPPLAGVSGYGGGGSSFNYGPRSNLGGFSLAQAQNNRQHQPPKMNDLKQFYMEPTDMMSWEQYNFSFKFCIEMCLDALCKSSKQLFVAHLNMISRMVVGYQVIAKMEKPELIALSSGNGNDGANVGAPIIDYDEDALDKVRLILRKITSALAQFTINGYLHLSAAADSPNYLGSLGQSGNDGKGKGAAAGSRSGLSRKAKQQHSYKEKDLVSVGGSASSSSCDDGEVTDFGADGGSDSDVDSDYSDSDSDFDEEDDEDNISIPSTSAGPGSNAGVGAKPTTPKLVLNDGSGPIKSTAGPTPTKARSTFNNHNKQNSLDDEHEAYLKQARKNATKLLNRAQDLFSQFAKMSIAKGEDPKLLPLCYPRFFKNRFQGGNFKNQFIDCSDGHNGGFSGGWNSGSGSGSGSGYSAGGSSVGGSGYGYGYGFGGAKQQSDAFMDDSSNNSMRLLLDDSLYDRP